MNKQNRWTSYSCLEFLIGCMWHEWRKKYHLCWDYSDKSYVVQFLKNSLFFALFESSVHWTFHTLSRQSSKCIMFSDKFILKPLEFWMYESGKIRNFLMWITWCTSLWWCFLENRLVPNNVGNSCSNRSIDWSHSIRQRMCVHAFICQTYAIFMYFNVSPGELNNITAARYLRVLFNFEMLFI